MYGFGHALIYKTEFGVIGNQPILTGQHHAQALAGARFVDHALQKLGGDALTEDEAIAKAAELAGMRTYAVVSLEPESDDLSDLVGLLSSSKMSNEDLIERLKELNGNGSQH